MIKSQRQVKKNWMIDEILELMEKEEQQQTNKQKIKQHVKKLTQKQEISSWKRKGDDC